MKRTKGFTLVELVIVIIIVGILSIVAVPIYRGYTRRAYASEGKALVGSIQTAQKVYYAENGFYFTTASTSTISNESFDVNAKQNKYFTAFAISGGANTFTATTSGSGSASDITVSLTVPATGTPILTDNV